MLLRNVKFIISIMTCVLLMGVPLHICVAQRLAPTTLSNPVQPTQQRNPVIAGISVEGNVFVDESSVISIAGLRVGQELNPRSDAVQNSIKALWSRRQFSDVDIYIDKVTSLGVFLKIVVKEYPRLSYFSIAGNDKLGATELKKAVNKVRGDIISPYDMYIIKKDLLKLYEKEGLMFATVTINSIATDTAGYDQIQIVVNEGQEYKVKNISIKGTNKVTESELISSFEDTKTKQWWQFWKSSKFDRTKFTADKQRLIQYMRNHGFLDTDIIFDTVRVDEKEGGLDIALEILEGNQYFLRNVYFEGNTVYPSEILERRLNVEKGKPIDMERIDKNLNQNEDQTDVRSVYADNGYLQAQTALDLRRVAKDSIDLVVQITERDRFTIRRVEIVGNNKTQDRVVRRELFTRPGDFFNRAAIIRSVKGLGVLNYFNPEKLRPDVKPAPGSSNIVDLLYNVEERSTDMLNASVGFAGQFGFTGSVGVVFNNFDISDPLRGGAGQVFSFQWDFGQANRLRTLSLSFSEPWLFGTPTTLGFNVYDSQFFLNWQGRTTGASLNIGRRLRFPDDYFRADWNLTTQRVLQQNIGNSAQNIDQFEVSIGQNLSRISLDNLIFPTSGSRFSYNSRIGLGSLGLGNANFWRNDVNVEFVNPLLQVDGFTRLVLYVNTDFGSVSELGSGGTGVPQLYRYFMGGNGLGGRNITPLRGYPDFSISDRAGSKFLIRQGAELRFALSLNPMPIYLLAFAEAGNAFNNLTSSEMFNLKRSAGLGVRILLNPIGLIGFDYGYGFDNPTTSAVGAKPHGWQFHFQFGR